MLRLRSHSNCPPGEFRIRIIFREGQESYYFGPCKGVPNCKLFGPSPIIGDVAKALSAFRAANGVARSSYVEALEDVDSYTCQRIGGLKEWCWDTDKSYAAANPAAVKATVPCGTCGQTLT